MKRWNFVGILLFVLLFVVACSNNESTDQSSDKQESKSKENVELTISAAASLKDAMDVIQHEFFQPYRLQCGLELSRQNLPLSLQQTARLAHRAGLLPE